jgi:hypothetical protein
MTLRARRSPIIAHRAAPVNRESTEAGCGKLPMDRTDEEAEDQPDRGARGVATAAREQAGARFVDGR